MTCREYREAHPAASAEARAHVASCASCRSFARSWELLKEYRPIQPGAGFYQALRRKLAPRILRFAATVSAAAAALLVAVILTHQPPPAGPAEAASVSEEEKQILENWDLLQNYELLQQNYDLLRTLEFVGDTRSPILEEKR